MRDYFGLISDYNLSLLSFDNRHARCIVAYQTDFQKYTSLQVYVPQKLIFNMSIGVNSVRCKSDNYLDVKGQLCLETWNVFTDGI